MHPSWSGRDLWPVKLPSIALVSKSWGSNTSSQAESKGSLLPEKSAVQDANGSLRFTLSFHGDQITIGTIIGIGQLLI